jgi:hypothetical protein
MSKVVTAPRIRPLNDAPQQRLAGLEAGQSAPPPECFRGDERLRCRDVGCRWRAQCLRLIAEWRR